MDEEPTNLPVPFHLPQQPMLIEHSVGLEVVTQRPDDGYINATELCQRANKKFHDYSRLSTTTDFLEVLSAKTGIPVLGPTGLVQGRQGGSNNADRGTMVHPRVAINLGQWLSPEFDVTVSGWVFDWMSGNVRGYMPVHVQRYMKNRGKVPPTHFSMLNEIYLNLLAPLEDAGIIPPDSMMPDISTGRMFSGWLRSKGIDTSEFFTYEHEFVDGRRQPVHARLYPIEHLPDFRKYFHEVWLPERALEYFKERIPKALPHLRRLLQLPPAQN